MKLNQGKILAVDDIPANLQVISETLHNAGYIVSTALDGERAFKRLQHYQPDLILLDIQMPGLDGFEICRRLKADRKTRHIPIIFVTALSDTVNKVEGLEIGGVDYITKPFDCAELLARVKVHIQLQQSQMQLIQQSRLSLLGELIAGIAHEINNPINFIAGNLTHSRHYFQQLIDLIFLYQKKLPNPDAEIQDKLEEIDFNFLLQDSTQLFQSMETGSDRIRQVILSLRNFSRLDESEFKEVDIHQGLESTLLILQHRLHLDGRSRTIKIKKNYGNIPLIFCYASQLNQVFFHILMNAIDALTSSNVMKELIIEIITAMQDNQTIEIRILDNGSGMTPEICQQVFDPFFTTKEVGKGTGLGMAIAYQIITEKHGGTLSCSSELGKGTGFTISLPLN